MKVLGLTCGRRNSNTEIFVKEALMGAQELGAEVEIIRLQDLNIKPCTGCNACVIDLFEKGGCGDCVIKNDDLSWIDDKLLDCDGLIVVCWKATQPLKTLFIEEKKTAQIPIELIEIRNASGGI